MSQYAFGLTTPRDLLEKARREVARLEEATSSNAPAERIQDTAINAAWTLWHITDWIARSSDQRCRDAIERIRSQGHSLKTKPLPILQEHVLRSSLMAMCEALANGVKHLTLHEQPRFDPAQVLHPDIELVPFTVGVTMSAGISAIGEVSGAEPVSYVAKLTIDGTPMYAADAFKAALDYWDKFFADYDL